MVHFQALAARHLEFTRVEAKQVQDGGVDVRHVMAVAEGMVAEFVGRAVDGAPLDARPGKPDREAVRVKVAAVLPCAKS